MGDALFTTRTKSPLTHAQHVKDLERLRKRIERDSGLKGVSCQVHTEPKENVFDLRVSRDGLGDIHLQRLHRNPDSVLVCDHAATKLVPDKVKSFSGLREILTEQLSMR